MLPIKRVLCPTDFSDPSFKGIEAADELAQHFNAEIILLNVVTPMYPIGAPGVPPSHHVKETYEEQITLAKRFLEDVSAKKISANVKTKKIVSQGNAPDEIIRQAQLEAVDLIVIATHGWTGWRRFIFGSVADKVVRIATCPVLTVCEHPEKE